MFFSLGVLVLFSYKTINVLNPALLSNNALFNKNRPRAFQEDSLYEHFVSVADACPAPLVVYNMVPVTGIDLSVDVLKKMAAHPNIVGVKDKDVSAAGFAYEKGRSPPPLLLLLLLLAECRRHGAPGPLRPTAGE